MSTFAANGSSQHANTATAVSDSVHEARQKLSHAPQLGLIFASAKHDLSVVLNKAKELCPGAALAACHTAGEYTEKGLTHGGLALLLVHSDEFLCRSAFAGDIVSDVDKAAENLSRGYSELHSEARSRGLGLSSTLLLLDGLVGTGDKLVKALQRKTQTFQNIVGGAAGDDGAFQKPWVGTEGAAGACGAAAINLFHRKAWSVGVGHGLTPQTAPMKVTRAVDNVVYEIDGRPAFEVYRDYAKTRGVDLTPDNASFLIGNELGVMLFNKLHHARAPVRVGSQGELYLVAEMTSRSQVCILDGDPNSMVAGCRQAAEEAKKGLGGGKAAAVVVFDCVCRGMILGDRFSEEIGALSSVFPDTPILGFLTYGEIARTGGRLDGWHNTTSVVMAIPS